MLWKRNDILIAEATAYSPQALQQIAESGSEILLLDPPARSNLQFVREVIRSLPTIRVVLLGMKEDGATFLRAVQAGVTGYVLKDASAMDVVAAVRAVVQDEAVCPPRLCLRTPWRLPKKASSALSGARLRW